MASPQLSFEKFDYALRPSKQVERKLLVQAFHCLSRLGYPISEYSYVGLGSVYYVDFILFHKYLYIDHMICIEHAPVPRRMKFNKPYDFIQLKMQPVCRAVPSLHLRHPAIVWLDYDFALRPSVVDDIDQVIQVLPKRSFLLVTLDGRPTLPEEDDNPLWNDVEREKHQLAFFREHFDRYATRELNVHDLAPTQYPRVLARILRNRIAESLLGQPGHEFTQLFNYAYADNAPMLTLGGVIESRGAASNLVNELQKGVRFVTDAEKPIRISVPPLTERERRWIDSELVGRRRRKALPFELKSEFLRSYLDFARHYPVYHEAFL